MKHRIRVANIIINSDKVLLIKHVDPKSGYIWWVPPGGGVEEKDLSIFECAKRETFEETNLIVNISKIIYLREFLDKRDSLEKAESELNIEVFLLADSYNGEVNMDNVKGSGPDELYIKEVKWFSKEDIQEIIVYPEILKDDFWNDYKQGFPKVKYLGRQV